MDDNSNNNPGPVSGFLPNVAPQAPTVANGDAPFMSINRGEKEMADIVTGNVTGLVNSLPEYTFKEVADHRRETEAGFCRTNAHVLEEGQENFGAIKDARHDVIMKVDQTGDRLADKIGSTSDEIRDRLFAVGRDTMDLRAQVVALGIQVRDNAQLSALQTEKAVLQNTIEGQKNTTYLSDKISSENEKTRDLINDLKYHDLNRGLVERNTELVECEADRRHWRHVAEQSQFAGQWAQLQSQIQAFQSQLQETRQGMVNFGTMAGVGQSSTSNNVR